MAVFYIGSYDIIDPDEFKKYPPVVMALLPKYGGVVLASDTAASLRGGHGALHERHHPVPIEGGRARALQRSPPIRRPNESARRRRRTSAWFWLKSSTRRRGREESPHFP